MVNSDGNRLNKTMAIRLRQNIFARTVAVFTIQPVLPGENCHAGGSEPAVEP